MGVARIEPLAAVIRFWSDPGHGYGDPYDWCATLRWVDPETVEVLGITRPPTAAIWRAVLAECRAQGVAQVIFYRIRSGGVKIRRVIHV